jgi:hypothetical protein
MGRIAGPLFWAMKSLAGDSPIVRTARPLQISIPLGAVNAKAKIAAKAVAAAISHFDFQISGPIYFRTLPASGVVLGGGYSTNPREAGKGNDPYFLRYANARGTGLQIEPVPPKCIDAVTIRSCRRP